MTDTSQTFSSITDWMSAVGSDLSAIGVVVGVFLAWKQLGTWRAHAKALRKAEIAEGLLASASSVVDLMKAVRTPLASVPIDQSKNKNYVVEQKIKRLSEGGTIFQTMRQFQVKAKIVIQDTKVDGAVEKLFQTRLDFWNAVEILIDYDNVASKELKPEEKELLVEARRSVFATYGTKDALNQTMSDALLELETYLGPTIRMNS